MAEPVREKTLFTSWREHLFSGKARPARQPDPSPEEELNRRLDTEAFLYPTGRDASGAEEGDRAVEALVDRLLAGGIAAGASDIHFEPGENGLQVRFRVDGELAPVERVCAARQLALVARLKLLAGLDLGNRLAVQDGRFRREIRGSWVDFRLGVCPGVRGEAVTVRILQGEATPTLGELGLSVEQRTFLEGTTGSGDGLLLVVGPTGAGKTTTLYTCLNSLNTPDRKLVTVEDPVEYQLPGIVQVPLNERAGVSFSSALRAVLRQAPDVVMVGEIRDAETAAVAVGASLTGHLVLSTLHASDTRGAVHRLADLGVDNGLLAAGLRAVVAQRLVRRICSQCAEDEPVQLAERRLFESAGVSVPDRIRRGRGCLRCRQTGYRGRVGLFEFLSFDWQPAKPGQAGPWCSLRFDGLAKAAAGETTPEEVQAAASENQTGML